MKMLKLSARCTKEILRDPLNLAFGLGFPLVLLLLLTAIQANIPVSLFELERLAPGICIFGLSFMTLFGATLISKDRESAFLQRLYTAPLKASDFILSYALPIIPMSVLQSAICFLTALILGLKPTFTIITSLIFIIPVSIFYISLGLICGSIFNSKQVGGICGALFTNLSAFLSGIWFDLELVGGFFKSIAYALPFVHAVELEQAALLGNFENLMPHLLVVLAYASVSLTAAILLFLRQMKRQ